MAVGVKLVLSGLLCALLLGGGYDYLFNLEMNKCRMTYMYEYPHFIPLRLPTEVRKKFPHYSLIVYGEGNYSETLKKGKFSGIPVLFIPGNGGSHKQVRSLASVAYRKAMDHETKFHFNFFAVNINEELGALYGPVLERQTEFVTFAIQHILKLYEDSPRKPKSVVLIGHSMGGMVARAAHVTKNISATTAPLIITQATPHTRPVIVTDPSIEDFYDKVNSYWTMERMFDLKDLVLVTVGGGRNDVQVSTAHINTPLADIATTTTNIPSCWLTADHQAIVWCHQLVMPIMRSLFDIVDPKTYQITTDRQRIINVFDYHLSKRIIGKRYKGTTWHSSTIEFDIEADWKEILRRQHTHTAQENPRPTYLMIPLHPGHHLYQKAMIVATNLDKKDWVMACQANHVHKNTRMCLNGENLSQMTRRLLGKVKAVELDLTTLSNAGHSHVVVYLPPTDEKVEVSVDVHGEGGRQKDFEVPAFIKSFTQTLIVDTTPQRALSYNVSLQGLHEPWQSFKFTLRPRSASCVNHSVIQAKIFVPWAQKESILQNSDPVKSFYAEVDVLPPADRNFSSASIQFVLDPDCSYSIVVQGNLLGIFRRIVSQFGQQVPTYIAVHLLLTLARQLQTLEDEGYCPTLFSAMLTLTPLAVIPFVKVMNMVLKNMDVYDDFSIMEESGQQLAVLPILFFLGTLPLSLALGGLAWGFILFFGNSAHFVVTKVLGRSLGGGDMIADLAVSGLSRVPVLLGVALISLAYSTCGTLALCLAGFFYFIKVFKLYEDFIEKIVVGLIPGTTENRSKTDKALSQLNFHMTLMMIIFLVSALNAPAFIVWGKLLSHNLQLVQDPSLYVAVTVLIGLCFLWQKKVPQCDKRFYKQLGYLVHSLAVLTLLYGSVNLYRVSYILSAAIILVVIHQLVAPRKPPQRESQEDESPSERSRPFMAQVDESESDGTNSGSITSDNDSGPSQRII
nr:GPI inositol-deacylase-like [Penaeus vannamei]XP_027238270.1 GPI inositol-deacylase-like [Penaeus vannamei]XP_027238271.1 GPI inositol-deacylase-like [Penaeus vannamei]